MKLRDDLENKILKSVIKELHRLVMYSIDNGQNSEPALDGDMWIDVYDKVDDATYSVNISWEYYKDYDETIKFNLVTPFNVVVYPTEEYENEQGEVRIREITDGDCVVLMN